MGQNKIADGLRSCPLLWAASGSAGAQIGKDEQEAHTSWLGEARSRAQGVRCS